MRGLVFRRTALLTTVSVMMSLCLAVIVAWTAGAASAAIFTSYPPDQFNQSGIGPFTWNWRSSDPSGPYGGNAYSVSTESGWHRCANGTLTLSDLPDGAYRVTIADDISINWWAAQGQGNSGHTAPCKEHWTTAPEGKVQTFDEIVVDSRPPEVSSPLVDSLFQTVHVSVTANDATSGIQRFRWNMGDGAIRDTTTSDIFYSYLKVGAYNGTVEVTDFAGNTTEKSFVTNLSTPTAPDNSPPAPVTPGMAPQAKAACGKLTGKKLRECKARKRCYKHKRKVRRRCLAKVRAKYH